MYQSLPLPSLEMRELVGPIDESSFDNPEGTTVFADIPMDKQRSIFDFGCGCGRIARQLIQQDPRPKRYLGIDMHRGMVAWCQKHLEPFGDGFEFLHHNIFSRGLNPRGHKEPLQLPAEDKSFSLVIAWSVFTHLVEKQITFYLQEVARILDNDGIFLSTWFTFDKLDFPMMQSFQNALYINDSDPTNAVIVDRKWLKTMLASNGLRIVKIIPPEVKGFQWELQIAHTQSNLAEVNFPPDAGSIGIARPPVPKMDPSKIG